MKIQKQLLENDCWRTCLAIVMNMNAKDVPHFYEDQSLENAVQALHKAKLWLLENNKTLFAVNLPPQLDFQTAIQTAQTIFPKYPVIISGESKIGLNHAVVVSPHGAIIDPYIGEVVHMNNPFKGPCKNGCYGWIVEVVVPL